MIIGIDATRANKPEKTGVEWYSYHVIREMVKLNTDHTIRLYFRNTPEDGLANLGPRVEYRILHWPLKYLWTQIRLSIEMFFNPPDLLFIPAQIIPLLHPAKTVTTIHDVAFKPYPGSYRPHSRWYLDFAVKLATKLPLILTVSEFSKSEITKYYGIAPEHIAVTPLAFTPAPQADKPMALTRFVIQEPYLIFIGRLERKKNISALIHSFNEIKKEPWGKAMHLVLVGVHGYGWDEIQMTLDHSPHKSDIHLVGWVSEQEKFALLNHAVAFISLSAYEGFGLPLLEAMDRGVPVIASDQASLPEVAGDAAILVPRGNVRAVVDAVQKIQFDHQLRDTLINRGRARAQQFTWTKTAELTSMALDDVLRTRL